MKKNVHTIHIQFDKKDSGGEKPLVNPPAKTFPKEKELLQISQRILQEHCVIDRIDRKFELSLLILDDSQMTKINLKHRYKNTSTDVLSFPQFVFPDGMGSFSLRETEGFWEENERNSISSDEILILGDIVISYESCIRQANEKGFSIREECIRLLIHGILHLFGYDHEQGDKECFFMEKREQLLLQEILQDKNDKNDKKEKNTSIESNSDAYPS